MKNLNCFLEEEYLTILEKEEKTEELKNIDYNDLDLTDEDFIEYFRQNSDDFKKFLKSLKDSDMDEKQKEQTLRKLKSLTKNLNESVINEFLGLVIAASVAAVTPGLVSSAVKHKVTSTQSNYLKMIKAESDPEKKKELEAELETYRKVRFGPDGIYLKKSSIEKHIEDLKKKGKIPKDYSYETMEKQQNDIKSKVKELSTKKDKEPDEETVKDKDGVEWIKRKKERGDGFTYCRKDDRDVTMSQEEYKKRNAQKNESILSLSNYLIESII